ncbi:plasmid stabilization system protein ParE [Epilithonimonas xixisoli]|uniref:Plasmid stabilization system protein ParE n=2 Tax=Epilithonimonas xixisoli TaxID=1476462 RepID=A0A4R8I4Z0_9FLAO|nr:plasmid stabilization system protein ParE [Epilithonimonas xixisoli]
MILKMEDSKQLKNFFLNMAYKIVWSEFSEQQIDEIFLYYQEKSKSYNVAQKIITKILLAPDRLINNPRIGQKELSLMYKNIDYHYIVESNYKIIYSINDDDFQIKIVDIFDTRQNPTKIERESRINLSQSYS